MLLLAAWFFAPAAHAAPIHTAVASTAAQPIQTARKTPARKAAARKTAAQRKAAVQRILADTNALRRARGLKPLRLRPKLNEVAQRWAVQLRSKCRLVHNSSLYRQIPSGWTRAGENIAMGHRLGKVVAAWAASPGHRANMLGDYTHIGIGVVKGGRCGRAYYVQDFAKY